MSDHEKAAIHRNDDEILADSSVSFNPTDDSDQSEISAGRDKPSKDELQQSLRALASKHKKTQSIMLDEKIKQVNKHIQVIEQGIHPDIKNEMTRLREKRSQKSAIAEERKRLRIEAAKKGYESEVLGINAEKRAIETEIQRAKDRTRRDLVQRKRPFIPRSTKRGSFYTGHPGGGDKIVGTEFSEHVEVQLEPSEIRMDVEWLRKRQAPTDLKVQHKQPNQTVRRKSR